MTNRGLVLPLFVPGTLCIVINWACEVLFKHVRDDSCHKQDCWDNANLVQLPLILEFKCQFLISVLLSTFVDNRM